MSTKQAMNSEQLITENIDLWTSAIKAKKTQGRGSSKKRELYGIKKLRELILELAVRGKLVPQDPSDEPASVLLERIAAEKAQLVKDKKIKKPKKLPEIMPEEQSFELPNGWAWARIPSVVSDDKYAIKRGPFGSALKKAYFVPSGYKVYEQQHAINDDFYRGEYYIDEEKFQELSAFSVRPNDIIISCSGTVGRVAVAPFDMEPGIINQALLKITLNQSVLPNSYFKILFPAFYMKTDTLSDLQGTAQKNMVSVDTLKSEPFPCPPILEMDRIVTKVDELMALCDQLEQQTEASLDAHQLLVDTLLGSLLAPCSPKSAEGSQLKQAEGSVTNAKGHDEFSENWARMSEHFDTLITTDYAVEQLKQTILQLAVMGKLVPQDPNDEPASELLKRIAAEKAQLIKDKKIKKQKPLPEITDEEKPFELPEGWEWCRLDDICYGVTSGSTPPKTEFREDEGVPYLKVYNIRNQFIDFDYRSQYVQPEYHAKKLKRSILYPGDVVMNIVGPPLGKVAIIPSTHPEWNCNQAITFFRPINKRFNTYIYTYLKAGTFLNAIELIGTAGQDNISVTKSRSIVLPTPALEEQSRIVTKVDELMLICDQLKARLSEARTTQLNLSNSVVEKALV